MAIITQEQMMEVLDKSYKAAINGIPGSLRAEELADEYMKKYGTVEIAAKKLIENQIAKCSTSGFITGFGGFITMPVTVPANIASVLYVQMRMIASIAYMGGSDIYSDEVQTLVYVCLLKTTISDILKSTGIKVANKVTLNLLKKIPGKILVKINQKVGFRLVTKFGQKGIFNLVKVVPVAGALVGAGVDYFDTKLISKKAYNMFILDEID